MKSTLKRIFCIINLFFLLLTQGVAQDYMQISKKNGEVIQVFLGDIEKLTFSAKSIDSIVQSAEQLQAFFNFKCYPNPASDFVVLDYELINSGRVYLEIYNLSGQLIKQSVTDIQNAGKHLYKCNVANLDAGIYVLKLRHNKKIVSEKIIKTN